MQGSFAQTAYLPEYNIVLVCESSLHPTWIQLKNNFGQIVPLFQFSDLEWKALLTHSFCQLPETSKRTTLELSNSYPILNCWVLESFSKVVYRA